MLKHVSSMVKLLTRMPCMWEVWSLNLGQAKSCIELQMVHQSPPLQHLRKQICVALMLICGDQRCCANTLHALP